MDFKKILVVLDDTIIEERTDFQFNILIELIKELLLSYGYHADIEIKTIFTEFVYDVSPEHIMNGIDSESSKFVTDDYDFIITEGLSSYFWLHAFIPVPLICINPMNDP